MARPNPTSVSWRGNGRNVKRDPNKLRVPLVIQFSPTGTTVRRATQEEVLEDERRRVTYRLDDEGRVVKVGPQKGG